jgi:formamidopyrimidine-DNA glycosylase
VPELPDLLYISDYLQNNILRRTIVEAPVKQPIVVRDTLEQSFGEALVGKLLLSVTLRGPFINLACSGKVDLVINLMLAGKLQHQRADDEPEGHLCLSLFLDDRTRLHLCDEKKMAKAYLVRHGVYGQIPKYDTQGIEILSPEFTPETFRRLAAAHTRKQVRVFINDHTILSAIGNAYADEILYDAEIHPKTFVAKLSPQDINRLYASIGRVMKWGTEKVKEAGQPIQVKVREHMRVRNRKGKPCSRCGTTIRREGVRGYDVFFCPTCQPATRKLFIEWGKRDLQDR